jgi:hypothetical protein
MPLATTPLSKLLPLVIPYAPGCSEFYAEQQLRLASSEFCERTRMWREITTLSITGQDEPLSTHAYANIHEIESAEWEDGTPLEPVRFAALMADDLDETVTGQPAYITQGSANTVSVVPFATGDVRLTLILKPQSGPEFGVDGATTKQAIQNVIPEFMFQQYGDHIASGALARVLMTPKTEFYDPNRAGLYAQKFESACTSNFNEHIRGQQRAQVRARSSWI